jgi:replication-associated recombination protein RarA
LDNETGQLSFSEMPTPGGYLNGEVASALQKAIRRGDERGALFWASELDLAGFGGHVWKRLRIIASEDVGLADTCVAVAVRALYDNWRELSKKKDEPAGHYHVFLLHAVCLPARAPKSRSLDHALMLMYAGECEQLPIPDAALDMHTRRGRELGRGLTHFLEEGAKVANETIDDPYREEGQAALRRPKRTRPTAEQGQLELG